MSGLVLTVADAGRAALVNAANNGTAAVLMAAVGVSATSFTPSPATTSVPDEIKRLTTLSGEAVADDTMHVTVRDESADVYTVRAFGLYLADGTLFAVYSQADPIMEKSAQAMLLLAIDVAFADIDATQITFGDTDFLNPPATTERQGVVELATEAEATTGSDAVRAVTPRSMKAAVAAWLNNRFGEGAPSAFVKGLLTSASAAALRTTLEIKSAALKDEGAGKGLDADLLDGLHASAFAPASHGHDYLPTTSLGAYASYAVDRARGSYYGLMLGAATEAPVLMFTNEGLGGIYSQGTGWRLFFDGIDWHVGAPSGQKVWHAANDGSGSGLDADMLDGVHASGFLRNIADTWLSVGGSQRLYFSSTNGWTALVGDGRLILRGGGAAGPDTLTVPATGHLLHDGARIWTAANDGSGSGLDADLFDGAQAAAFVGPSTTAESTYAAHIARNARNNYFGILHGSGKTGIASMFTAEGLGGFYSEQFDGGGARWLLFYDGTDWHVGANSGRKIWNAANDGAGSGLDADLLDGLQSSSYAKLADFAASKAANGYSREPNGVIKQWGTVSASADAYANIAFPLTFPTACRSIVASVATEVGNPNAQANGPLPYAVTRSGASFYNAAPAATAWWMAIGD